MLKVLHVCPYYPPHLGGLENHVRHLAHEQDERGLKATVLTSNIGGSPSVDRRSGRRVVHRLPSFELGNDAVVPGLLRTIGRLSRDVDLVHLHGHLFYSTTVGAVARHLYGRPTLLTFHGDFLKQTRLGTMGKRLRDAAQGHLILRSMDRIIALTQHDASYLASRGARPESISVVPNGVELRRFSEPPPGRTVPDFKASQGIDADARLVLFVGRLVDQKGLEHLLAAVPPLLEADHSVHLLVLGEGPLLQPMQRLCEDLRIGSAVTFVGKLPVEDLVMAYHSSDVVAVPSLWEGMPLVVLEAAASGRPVVATDIGGASEFVDHMGTGLLVPPGDPEALARAISRVLGDEALARELSGNAKKRAEERFDLGLQVERTLDVYSEMMASRR